MPGPKLSHIGMSERTLILTVEDVINIALGPAGVNRVDFKLLQTVLRMFARQLRMLQQQVEIDVLDFEDEFWEEEEEEEEIITTPKDVGQTSEKKKKGREGGASDKVETQRRGGKEDSEMEDTKSDASKKRKSRSESSDRKKSKSKGGQDDEVVDSREDEAERGGGKKRRGAGGGGAGGGGAGGGGAGGGGGGGGGRRGSVVPEYREKSDSQPPLESGGRRGSKSSRVSRGTSGYGAQASESDARKKTGVNRPRVGSIEVVTLSEFDELQKTVGRLKRMVEPMPMPSMPTNEKLLQKISSGHANLTETMQAMQLMARVSASEKAVARLANMLETLAASGALPQDMVDRVTNMKKQFQRETQGGGMGAGAGAFPGAGGFPGGVSGPDFGASAYPGDDTATLYQNTDRDYASIGGGYSRGGMGGVTKSEMDTALKDLRSFLAQAIVKASDTHKTALLNLTTASKDVADKFETSVTMEKRIKYLNAEVADYAQQLNNFDTGITTQLQCFKEQVITLQSDLNAGLKQLEDVNMNKESQVVMELNERFWGLMAQHEEVASMFATFSAGQNAFGNEINHLARQLEILNDQKADRDEVIDGLRNKADASLLLGLVREEEFLSSHEALSSYLDACDGKFDKQDRRFMHAIKDLTDELRTKADFRTTVDLRNEIQNVVADIHLRQQMLEEALGEPKAAILMRRINKDGKCCVCDVNALMEPTDISFGMPPKLPAFKPELLALDEVCEEPWQPQILPDTRPHACNRWVGGSHTLLRHLSRGPPQELPPQPYTKKYISFGDDGRLYMCEENLQPCKCNPGAGGDNQESQGTDFDEKKNKKH